MRSKVLLGVATLVATSALALGGGSGLIGGACAASAAQACATPTFGAGGGGGGGTVPTTGNLWIVTSGGNTTCIRQTTPTTLANAANTALCASPQAAMNAMNAGDTTMIQSGTYPGSFTLSSGTKASAVTFAAAGWSMPTSAIGVMSDTITVVYTGGITLSGVDKVHILGVSGTSAPNSAGSGTVNQTAGSVGICATRSACPTQNTDLLIQGFHGHSFFSNGSGITVDLSEFGGFDDCVDYNVTTHGGDTEDAFRFWSGAPLASDQMSNDTLKRSVVHDEIMGTNNGSLATGCGAGSPSVGPHTDCFQSAGGANMLIDSDIFYNCPEQNFQWNPFSGQPMSTVTVQNSYFGPTAGSQLSTTAVFGTIGNGGDCSQILIRSNVMYSTNNASGCTTPPIVYNNIFLGISTSCASGTYSYNVTASAWSTTCGTNAQHCDPTFQNTFSGYLLGQAVPNPKLSASDTCAKGNGNPAAYPALDLLGVTRPIGAIDIGPTEV